MEKIFNKLVRDNIPEIIQKDGVTPIFEIIGGGELTKKLFLKLVEETKEVIKTNNPIELTEELADLMEVIRMISKINNIELADIEKVRLEKKEKRGGFEKGIFLIKTIR